VKIATPKNVIFGLLRRLSAARCPCGTATIVAWRDTGSIYRLQLRFKRQISPNLQFYSFVPAAAARSVGIASRVIVRVVAAASNNNMDYQRIPVAKAELSQSWRG
jgi:hypothetical protein